MIMLAQGDPDFRALINTSSLCLPDGVGLLWAARLTGQRLRQVVPGSFVVPWLAERSAQREHRWFLLGGAQGVAPEVANRLTTRFPTLDVAGTFAGHAGPQHDDASCAAVRAAGRVDVLLVAYGSPRQEMWIARNQARLGVPLAIGVGGTFNFIAGRSFRPPDWLHRIHLYWLGRLISEPWRWRRQLALVRFCALVVRQAVRYRLRGIGEP
jgi:N-acetylglucosaminyldiphosphoundecaprenol N-acetyl-beta-D-mannosaminyltransferase